MDPKQNITRAFRVVTLESLTRNNHKFLRSILLVKKMTLIDDKNGVLSKTEKKHITGFNLPYMASYNFIMKNINSDRLYEVVSDAFIKIENNNLHLKNEIALRKEIMNINKNIYGWFEKKVVIRKIDEIVMNHDLLVKLLYKLDNINEDQIEMVEDFLDMGVYELHSEYKKKKQEDFESRRMTIFKGDIPISVNNSIIFDKIFIVEQWIRRIIMFVLMAEYGQKWISVFSDEDLENYEDRRNKQDSREVIENKEDLLWYQDITFLAIFIKKRKDIKHRIENITNFKVKDFYTAIFKINEIRNEMAHNRTITKVMEQDYNEKFEDLQNIILNFKKNTINSDNGQHVSGLESDSNQAELIKYFNKLEIEQYNGKGIQSFIKEEDDYFSIVLLYCKPLGANFIDISRILEKNEDFKDYIVAFYVNKRGGEYQVIVSKTIDECKTIYRAILKTFFEIVEIIGTDLPYELQDPKYTCNTKIWFYEDIYPYESIEKLWES